MTRPCPTSHRDRRSFLRDATAGALSLCGLAVWACAPDRDAGSEGRSGSGAPARPIVLPWGEDAILVSAPASELPVAYVSRGLQRVYVDRELRDRAAMALAAHLSVSTGLWRIPLPGDPLRRPIQPGDLAREFEEHPLRAWDPLTTPTEGDFRVRLGRVDVVTLELACEPVVGTDRWCGGGPWEVPRCTPGGDRLCREILGEVGSARLWADRRCEQAPRTTRCVTWRASAE